VLPAGNLAAVVARLPTRSLDGVAFRLIHARYAATALSAIGALQWGGRYNGPHAFEALYLADSPMTALREVEALVQTAAGLLGVKGPPRILLSVEYTLGAVADLTDEVIQADLATNSEELCAPWRPLNAQGRLAPTQELGAAIHATARIEALKVPSARDRTAHNLVIFPDRLMAGSLVRVYDDSGLIDARLPSR
jgi:RES domain-containing protein